jgi:prepilin-type N-terminal cleavage/methylation domain-containing protein
MNRRARGFTLIEVLIVIVVGGILAGIAIKEVGPASGRASVQQARNVFNGMAARARAHAIERGQMTLLVVDAQADSVSIVAGGDVLETVHFRGGMGIDIRAPAAETRICMTPRGFAEPSCNSFSTAIKMEFVRGTRSSAIEILPLGQMRW